MHGCMLSWLTSIVNIYHGDKMLSAVCESRPVFIQGYHVVAGYTTALKIIEIFDISESDWLKLLPGGRE